MKTCPNHCDIADIIKASASRFCPLCGAALREPIASPRPVPVIGSALMLALPGNVPLELLPVASGTFLMGSPEDEPKRRDDETQHDVSITKPYWLGKFPVTQAQWQALMGSNPSWFEGAQLPVENVSWEEAQEIFCEKLTNQERIAGRLPTGYRYTLPTEAQWEYACRAGTTTPFNTGRNLTTDQANYDGTRPYNGNPKGEYRRTTTDVWSFPANAWGFYDMHGNVWEWCSDWYGSYPSGSATDPTGRDTGRCRVLRGGSWDNGSDLCRSADRYSLTPVIRIGYGFRVALAPASVR
jgi:formylglycine-generating enzyme required for sulfatase activity